MESIAKVSIITATYNSEKHIEQTIRSVLEQTYEHVEYIIVDGVSTDGTLDIIRKYQDKIDVLISEPDRGVYDAFNKGIKLATGDIIYFLNSDDYFYDNQVLEDVAREFSINSNTSIVYGNVLIKNEKNDSFQILFGRKLALEDFKKRLMPCHQGVFTKKELFYKHGLFNIEYKIASDFDFLVKCFITDEQKIKYIDRLISIFREGGLSSDSKKAISEKDRIIQQYFGLSVNEVQSLNDINIEYYRLWLEKILLGDTYLSAVLIEKKIKRVAIFGTKYTALYLVGDLRKMGIEIQVFLDNDIRKQGHFIQGIQILPPAWLAEHNEEVDAIILSFEGDFDEEVCAQIDSIVPNHDLCVVSWRDLITYS
ncbi:glycosyltransferase family 2 protein [Aneurinibacillus aneurinilyticus]|uniref:glycosyltransferase family 2 protein n=1 Tax=Aneurinibacillus aneurinilyticus TaxID=1391 RepID=UPI002E210046|nr:glycosyltransferase family 2 protein [Aneurinibacillus aneurinilyticus]